MQGRVLRSRTGHWGKQSAGDFMDLGPGAPGSSHEQSKCKSSSQITRQCFFFVKIVGLNTVGSIKGIIWIPSHSQQRSDGWQRRYMAQSQSNSVGQFCMRGI